MPDPGPVPVPATAAAPPPSRPASLVTAVALLSLQAVAFAVLGAGIAVTPVGEQADATAGQVYPVLLFTVVVVLLLGAVAWSLWRLRRWARGAAVAWSLLMTVVSLSSLSQPLVNVPLLLVTAAVTLATAVAAILPATRLALEAADQEQTDPNA